MKNPRDEKPKRMKTAYSKENFQYAKYAFPKIS
jgi:hypothetical protein